MLGWELKSHWVFLFFVFVCISELWKIYWGVVMIDSLVLFLSLRVGSFMNFLFILKFHLNFLSAACSGS